jgi:S1-C subfamily serine protease
LVDDLAPGANLSLEVWQDGQKHTFTMTVGKRPANAQGV